MSGGGAPTLAGTSMFTSCVKICTHMKCEVEHNVAWDLGMGHL